ncbi:MerR family transcriptional regulator [Bacillus timonensis]|nr:MerR family transcriptional regulator [Bacillus timonensis]
MNSQEGKYNIKAISKMLGIQSGTLRAWERRYNMIAPKRNESGHRLYTEDHVRILRWLIDKVDKGFTISQAVSLLESSQFMTESSSIESADSDKCNELIIELLSALLEFNEGKAHDILNQAFSIYTIDKVVIDILGTLLVKIGDLWEEGKITTAHEHFASSFLRSRIGMVLHTIPVNSMLPKVVAVCGPDEWHELGLLIFTLFIRRKGFEVVYLGTSLAEGDLEVVIKEVNPKFLFLSCTMKNNIDKTLNVIDSFENMFPELKIGIGGYAVTTLSESKSKKYSLNIVGENQKEWEDWLKNNLM